ncbi:MAG: hypothetical protein JWP52_2096 [Rhizobacter sp.]|nr:hypothetical protein [Rhizobacter sp.]
MNLALPALIVFILLLPGFVVRLRFKRAERASLDYSPFGQVATEAILWAAALHAVWLLVAYAAFDRVLQLDVLLKLLSSDASSQSHASEAVAADAHWVAWYFGSLFVCAYALPALARAAIIRWRLDRIGSPLSALLRFNGAPWYYLLTGADFAEGEQPDLIAISAVVDVAGSAVLYTGILEDFFLDPEGRLDRLVLQQTMRRPMNADKASWDGGDEAAQEWFYPIEGDYFVLRYAEAITLNIEYISLGEQTD